MSTLRPRVMIHLVKFSSKHTYKHNEIMFFEELISFVSLVYKRKVATIQIENDGLSFLVVSIFLVKNHNELIKQSQKGSRLCK